MGPLVTTEELARHPGWRVFDCRHDLMKPHWGAEAFRAGHLTPVYFGSALKDMGVQDLIDAYNAVMAKWAEPDADFEAIGAEQALLQDKIDAAMNQGGSAVGLMFAPVVIATGDPTTLLGRIYSTATDATASDPETVSRDRP